MCFWQVDHLNDVVIARAKGVVSKCLQPHLNRMAPAYMLGDVSFIVAQNQWGTYHLEFLLGLQLEK